MAHRARPGLLGAYSTRSELLSKVLRIPRIQNPLWSGSRIICASVPSCVNGGLNSINPQGCCEEWMLCVNQVSACHIESACGGKKTKKMSVCATPWFNQLSPKKEGIAFPSVAGHRLASPWALKASQGWKERIPSVLPPRLPWWGAQVRRSGCGHPCRGLACSSDSSGSSPGGCLRVSPWHSLQLNSGVYVICLSECCLDVKNNY